MEALLNNLYSSKLSQIFNFIKILIFINLIIFISLLLAVILEIFPNYIYYNCIFSLIPITIRHYSQLRDSKGRFRSPSLDELPIAPNLDPEIEAALVGNMLGDGWIGFKKKGVDGKPKPTVNACFSITLKNEEYINHLLHSIYSPICNITKPVPWPSEKSGKPASQYNFWSKALPSLTQFNKLWYIWSDSTNKFSKIVPQNIMELLTPIGLALWIMDDGFKSGKAVILCTECFTKIEVELLKNALESKFGLITKIYNRTTSTGKLGYRLCIISDSRERLIELVKPHFVPSMYYKLGLD